MYITACQVNHLTDPLGYLLERTVFSWRVEDAQGTRAEASRLCVRQGGAVVYDSGWAQLDSLAAPAVFPLRPRTRYTWRVSVRTDRGEEARSEENWFETGRMDEPWQAQWIGCADAERLPVFSRRVTPERPVRSARLYICGLGLYEAAWNGERIGSEYMTPYCTNYDAWVQYQTYDVTAQLQQAGELSVTLADGWYAGRFGFTKDGLPYYRGSRKLLAELILTYDDGSEQHIGTDPSWRVTRSRITFSGIYDGEHRDDTLPELPPEPALPVDPPRGAVTARLSTPVAVRRELPVTLLRTPAGETVFDTHQNMTGIFRLRVHVPAGRLVRLQFGEVLQNGNFYNGNLRSAKAEYRYLSDGAEHILSPRFTFYGYRYVRIEGVEAPDPADFTALVLHSELPVTGRLTTGHALVNRLIRNAEWGHIGNFLDVPTDCPQRDERMGWTGDAQVFAPTACYLRSCFSFFAKYLRDLASEQACFGGEVPQTVPSFGMLPSSAAWGDAACIIPWVCYEYSGDSSILSDQFDSMCAWVAFMDRLEQDGHGWRDHFHFGDWLALDGPGGIDGVQGGTDKGYIALTYLRCSAELTARAADVLGRPADAARMRAIADRTLAELRAEYFTPTGRCTEGTQTGLLLALHHHLSPDEARTRRDLAQKMAQCEGRLKTGFVGTPILCEELMKAGMEEQAFRLLVNEEYPGWLYSVKLGATTVWERWNSILPDGSISSTGMNSLNHYAYGSIVAWLYRDVAGIAPAEPGFRSARLRPHVSRTLGSAEAEYISAAGTWRAAWQILPDGRIRYRCTVPFGCTATLDLPRGGGHYTLQPGDFTHTYTPDTPV